MQSEFTGEVVGTRGHREEETRLLASTLGEQVATIHVRCEGASLPALAQCYDAGSLRAARVLRVLDCTIGGARGWIVHTEGDVASVLTSHTAKEGDAVVLAIDVDAQPRTMPVGR